MFFDSITLKRTGWYVNVLNFVFPHAPKYSNFCPFFWLTVIALCLSPFKLLLWYPVKYSFMGIGFIFIQLAKPVESFVDFMENQSLKSYERKLENYSPEELAKAGRVCNDRDYYEIFLPKCEVKKYVEIWKLVGHIGRENALIYDQFISKVRSVDGNFLSDWAQQVEDDYVKRRTTFYQTVKERERQTKKREEANRKLFARAIKIGKIMLPIILAPIAILIGYYLVLILGWSFYWIWYAVSSIPKNIVDHWTFLWQVFSLFGMLVVGSVVLWYSAIFIVTKTRSMAFNFPNWLCKFGQRCSKVFMFLGRNIAKASGKFCNGIVVICRAIASICNFFWMFAKTFKSNNCPHIDWVE